jgi:putative aldouronate transport system permease protein
MAAARKSRFTARALSLYGMVVPAFLLLLVFNYVPIYGVIIGFEDFVLHLGPFRSPWIGLQHFRYFLGDPKFWSVMRNTLIINFYDIAFGFTAPIVFAILANELTQRRFKRTMQTISYLPNFLSWVVMAGMMYQVLSPSENGLANFVLGKLFGIHPIYFMTEVHLFRGLVVGLDIWKSVGWGAILYFAALAGIDPGLYEAAYIDGASRLQQVFSVTLPGLAPIIVLMFLLRLSTIFTIGFERIFLLQNPVVYSVSDVIATYVYRLGLEQAQFGLTTAIGFTQSVLGFALLLGANSLSRRLVGLGLY